MIFSRLCLLAVLLPLIITCTRIDSNQQDYTNNHITVDQDSLILIPEKGLIYYNGKPFSGTSIQTNHKGQKTLENEYKHGKRHGVCKKWFDNRVLSYESHYLCYQSVTRIKRPDSKSTTVFAPCA